MIESRCGILCSSCEFKDSGVCNGCLNISKPFWGDVCLVKKCCEDKGLNHCGECSEFPCELLSSFAYDKEQGDNGTRIIQCKNWKTN